MDTIKIEIPSIDENIRIIESFIDNAKEKFNLDDEIYGNIMIAVTESVNNAIKHGNKQNRTCIPHGRSAPNLLAHLDRHSHHNNILMFRVEDEGGGFDFSNLPDPTSPENINKPSGRGIFLMKHLSDEVNFHNDGRVVELCFYMD